MLIGVLVVVALTLLVSAFLTGTTVLAGAALVVSLAAAVLYVIALRRDPDGADGPPVPDAAEAPEKGPAEKVAAAADTAQEPATVEATEPDVVKAPEKDAELESAAPAVVKTPQQKAPEKKAAEKKATETKAPEPAAPAVATAPEEPAASELAGTTVVHVVPGRMRYHVQGCQVIDGQQVEDLTVDDARDEGFTACSRCAARGRSHATA